MRLYPLEPTGKLAINISTFSRRLRLRVMAGYLYEEELKGLIIVTDGTPDDYVVACSLITSTARKPTPLQSLGGQGSKPYISSPTISAG